MTTVMEERETDDQRLTEGDHNTLHGDQPRYYDFNMPVIIMVAVISTILVVVTIAFVQGLYYQWANSYIRARSTDYVNQPVQLIIDAQKEMLDGNAENGVKPVAETMEQIVEQYGKH